MQECLCLFYCDAATKRIWKASERLKGCQEKVSQSKENPTNPSASPEHLTPEDNQKDPPYSTSILKEPYASIDLDSGSNIADQ